MCSSRVDSSIPEQSFAVTVKQEEEEEPHAKKQGAVEGVEFSELGVEDSIIQIKQEEGLCTADRKEEAAEAPAEPCPAERGFYEPEASSQTRNGSEVDARELPGTEGEHLQRDPAT
ncbi:hypothetical protein EK904_013112, partial [Melospiza melodia maxima]